MRSADAQAVGDQGQAMSRITQAARGQPCLVRLPGCDGGGETTVAAHYRLAGLCGVGMKPIDLVAAWCCHSCHDVIDGRKPAPSGYSRELIRLAHAEGVMRTIAELQKSMKLA